MIKHFVNYIAKKRDVNFKLDPEIPSSYLIELLFDFITGGIRGVILFRSSPRKLNIFGKGCKIKCRSKVTLGSKLKFGDYVKINGLGKGGVYIGDNVSIGDYSSLVVSSDLRNLGENIILHKGVGIGEYSRIGGSGGVEIGEDTIIGQYFTCHPENHNYQNVNVAIKYQGTKREGIFVGKGCWFGSKVTILAGTIIGDNTVIAAGAVVSGEFPPNCIIGGIPAKILKNIG